MNARIQSLLDEISGWAEGRPDILGLALVGSYARGAARPDSDLDLVLLAAAPQALIEQPEWTAAYGQVASRQVEDWGLVTSLRVHYQDGLEVEYGLTGPEWATPPIDAGTARVMRDGMRILSDKMGLLEKALREVLD
jgi:predicted nucleotidyltransferase